MQSTKNSAIIPIKIPSVLKYLLSSTISQSKAERLQFKVMTDNTFNDIIKRANTLGYNTVSIDTGLDNLDICIVETQNTLIIVTNNPIAICNARCLFFNTNFKEIDISEVDFSHNISVYSMFKSCSKLEKIQFGNFNTQKVKDMESMFNDCIALEEIDIHSFNTHNVTNMANMFHGCKSLKSIDFSNLDTSNVKKVSSLFRDCSSLRELDISRSDLSNIESVWAMLEGMELDKFNISNIDIRKLEDTVYKAGDSLISNMSIASTATQPLNGQALPNLMYTLSKPAVIKKLIINNIKYNRIESIVYLFDRAIIGEIETDNEKVREQIEKLKSMENVEE